MDNVINNICQVVMAISSVIAIVIAIMQIRYRRKPNLKLSYSYAMGLHKNSNKQEIIAGISVKIINLGLSPVYIEYCGLQFVNKEKKFNSPGIMTEYNVVKIAPGESFSGSIPHVELLLNNLENEVALHDKMYIYVQLCNGKTYKVRTNEDYASFKHEFLKVAKKVSNKNKQAHRKCGGDNKGKK